MRDRRNQGKTNPLCTFPEMPILLLLIFQIALTNDQGVRIMLSLFAASTMDPQTSVMCGFLMSLRSRSSHLKASSDMFAFKCFMAYSSFPIFTFSTLQVPPVRGSDGIISKGRGSPPVRILCSPRTRLLWALLLSPDDSIIPYPSEMFSIILMIFPTQSPRCFNSSAVFILFSTLRELNSPFKLVVLLEIRRNLSVGSWRTSLSACSNPMMIEIVLRDLERQDAIPSYKFV